MRSVAPARRPKRGVIHPSFPLRGRWDDSPRGFREPLPSRGRRGVYRNGCTPDVYLCKRGSTGQEARKKAKLLYVQYIEITGSMLATPIREATSRSGRDSGERLHAELDAGSVWEE